MIMTLQKRFLLIFSLAYAIITPRPCCAVSEHLHQAVNAISGTIAHQETAFSLLQYAATAYQVASWPSASPQLTAWIQSIIKEHPINRIIQIRVNPNPDSYAGFSALGNSTILLSLSRSLELEHALQNPTTEKSQTTLEVARTYLRHEIAHLMGNDSTKLLLANFLMSLVSHMGSVLIASSGLVKKSTSFLGFIAYSAVSFATGALQHFFHKKALRAYSARQEKTADDYAFATANNSQELRAMAHYLENKQDEIIQLLSGKAEINPILGDDVKAALAATKQQLEARYAAQAPQEPYHTWIKKQVEALHFEEIIFPGRPLLSQTIADAYQSAQKLEVTPMVAPAA